MTAHMPLAGCTAILAGCIVMDQSYIVTHAGYIVVRESNGGILNATRLHIALIHQPDRCILQLAGEAKRRHRAALGVPHGS